MKKIKDFIKDKSRSLRWIISWALGIVAGLTLFIFAFINIGINRGSLIDNAVTSTEQSVHLTYSYLKNYHDTIVQRSSRITDELRQIENEPELLRRMENVYQENIDIISLTIFDADGSLESYAPQFLDEPEITNLYELEWYESSPDKFEILLSAPHLQSTYDMQPILVISMIKNITVNGQPKYIVLDYNFSQVGDYFDRVSIGEQGYAYIANRAGKVLYHPKPAQFTEAESTAIDSVLHNGDGTYVTENGNYSVGYRTISNTGWKVVGLSYLDDIVAPAMNDVMKLILYTLLIMFALIVVVSILVSKYISEPITQMVRQISNDEVDGTEQYIHQDRFKEVRQLSDSYNRQMDRINDLMEQIKQEQAELRKSEMDVLQAQINPHFLYNTLDSILWMAESGETDELIEMTAALGNLLRISLSQGDNLISLERELDHANNYLTIQKFRYKDNFTYSIEAEDHLLDYLTVKIIIQPFLENALYHGIEYMIDPAHISVRVMEEGAHIRIEIEDNGVGMTPERLAHIQKLKDSYETGIGIRNVHQRIQVYFGKEYGVEIDSELDVGTVVNILIPKVKSKDKLDIK